MLPEYDYFIRQEQLLQGKFKFVSLNSSNLEQRYFYPAEDRPYPIE